MNNYLAHFIVGEWSRAEFIPFFARSKALAMQKVAEMIADAAEKTELVKLYKAA